jgi:transcriptional antiterminator NusG
MSCSATPGYENKVRHNLEQRIDTMGMKDKIFDVVIPTQEEIEVRTQAPHS